MDERDRPVDQLADKDLIASLMDERDALRIELIKSGRALASGGCKWASGCLRSKAWEPTPDVDPEFTAQLDASIAADRAKDDKIAALEGQIERLRTALGPFARLRSGFLDDGPDEGLASVSISIGKLREARAAL